VVGSIASGDEQHPQDEEPACERKTVWWSFSIFAALTVLSTGVAADGAFDQSDWTSHLSDPDTAKARHPRNQTGWLRYEAAPAGISAGDIVTLRSALLPISETRTATSRSALSPISRSEDRRCGLLALPGGFDVATAAMARWVSLRQGFRAELDKGFR